MKTMELIQIEKIQAKFLPELQGWKEKQEALVEENPFLKIEDNKTYNEAKKRRTSLVAGRTTIQNQDKLIASKIKQFRSNVSEASRELIAITQPHEERQQEEVKRYEQIKADEKAEKIRLDEDRKRKIKNFIENLFNGWTEAISNLTFDKIDDFLMESILDDVDTGQFQEFELDFAEKVQLLKQKLADKIEQLNHSENQRLEDLRLKKERAKFEEEKKEAAKKQKLEDEKRNKEQAEIDYANKIKSDELAKKEAAIKKEKERLDSIESDRLAKIESEKQAKIDAESKLNKEKKIKAKKEAEQKRIDALKPDVEKLAKVINSLSVPELELKSDEAKFFLGHIQLEVTEIRKRLTKELQEFQGLK